MSSVDLVAALVSFLQTNIRLVKDDESLGKVSVSREWFDRELLKTYDAQVTVGLGSVVDRKLGLSASQRLIVGSPKVNVWVTEKGGAESGQSIRQKMRLEINRVIRENRTKVPDIAYVDIVSFRDADIVDVKPFVWRTEFTLKTWVFEYVTVT
ncbi:MAG: hypothetical protein NWE93_01675 [Candidatus Bathyarchaeota archaeon]|nr:hypothetical protein [Candidatus Bathyarchaeota archaeon]